jgi:hypothetical protein
MMREKFISNMIFPRPSLKVFDVSFLPALIFRETLHASLAEMFIFAPIVSSLARSNYLAI